MWYNFFMVSGIKGFEKVGPLVQEAVNGPKAQDQMHEAQQAELDKIFEKQQAELDKIFKRERAAAKEMALPKS